MLGALSCGNSNNETDIPFEGDNYIDWIVTGAFATPSTYEIDGKQYIALGVGGNCKYCSEGYSGRLSTPSSDLFIVFALPD